MQSNHHIPVLLSETIAAMAVQPKAWYIDGTFGLGGHTRAILEKGGSVIAFDWDKEAIARGNEQFAIEIAAGSLILIHRPFSQLLSATEPYLKNGLEIMGILFDFGTNTPQLTSGERGFSFLSEGPLDMRMDDRLGVQAKDLLAVLSEKQLARIFSEFGGEHEAKQVARAIKQSGIPITTTLQLANLIERVKHERRGHLHPATKVFQALRIAVNSELDEIAVALPQALKVVSKGGLVATIAFHEGEDRIAKQLMKDWEQQGYGSSITKKPILATEEEIARNSNSRSAKLRVFRKN